MFEACDLDLDDAGNILLWFFTRPPIIAGPPCSPPLLAAAVHEREEGCVRACAYRSPATQRRWRRPPPPPPTPIESQNQVNSDRSIWRTYDPRSQCNNCSSSLICIDSTLSGGPGVAFTRFCQAKSCCWCATAAFLFAFSFSLKRLSSPLFPLSIWFSRRKKDTP